MSFSTLRTVSCRPLPVFGETAKSRFGNQEIFVRMRGALLFMCVWNGFWCPRRIRGTRQKAHCLSSVFRELAQRTPKSTSEHLCRRQPPSSLSVDPYYLLTTLSPLYGYDRRWNVFHEVLYHRCWTMCLLEDCHPQLAKFWVSNIIWSSTVLTNPTLSAKSKIFETVCNLLDDPFSTTSARMLQESL